MINQIIMGFLDLFENNKKDINNFFDINIKEKYDEVQKKFNFILESSKDIIIFLDEKNNIIDINTKGVESLGHSKNYFIGKNFTDIEILNNNKGVLGKDDLRNILSKKIKKTIKLNVKNKNVDFLSNVFLIKNKGKITGKIIVLKDITFVKKYQSLIFKRKKEKEIEEIKNSLFTLFSHELRHPLMSILGFSKMLLEKSNSQNQKQIIKKIIMNSEHLNSLVNKALYLEEIKINEDKLQRVKFNIGFLIVEILNNYTPLISKNNIKIIQSINSKELMANPDMIKTLLTNIIENSIKNTKKGEITLSSYSKNDKIIIEIKDSGIGMEPYEVETLKKDFIAGEEFYNKMYKGISFNYLINRLILKIHKATIEIESKKNVGTTVKLYFPSK